MTDNWSGFTDSEINNIIIGKSFNIVSDPKLNRNGVAVAKRLGRESQRRFPKKNVVRERMLNGDRKPTPNLPGHSLSKDARLFIPQIPEEEEEDEPEETGSKGVSEGVEMCARDLRVSEQALVRGIDALAEFQEKQKRMEEQNKRTKELLQKTLADRAKVAREEARRLDQIDEELRKLDASLSNDVSVIRDQIEQASHLFTEAQKRYDKAEREFLEAKLALFNHKERKEMLTSHLCTIIEQNEIRKAKKLSDLMEKLQLPPPSSPPSPKPQEETNKKAPSSP